MKLSNKSFVGDTSAEQAPVALAEVFWFQATIFLDESISQTPTIAEVPPSARG